MIHEGLTENLVSVNSDAETQRQILKDLASRLYKGGFVKDSYMNAVIGREILYPTAIDMNGIGVAIPHTDTNHVNEAKIAVATLKKPVTFIQMATQDVEVPVTILFMLAITNPDKHIELLQRIVAIIQDEEVLHKLQSANTAQQIIDVIREKESLLDN
ncbi:MAG: PTS sugar transporter subunit IIA [Bifidobacteriaceae bacterium]|jgi:PTS system galactitol-specific IIA component|nr:PTS sugar transporter subunit IIA [Bifidobacteriaceae bacterium]